MLALVSDRPPLRKASRPIAAFLLVRVVGVAGFVVLEGVSVIGAAFGGQIREELKRVQTERQTEELSGHVVCGYGIFGRTIADTLGDARCGETYSTLARPAGVDEGIVPVIASGQQVSRSISGALEDA